MRRIVAVVALACAVLVTGLLLATGSDSAETSGSGTLGSNKAAAKADAAKLLTEVKLPSGKEKLRAEPVGDSGYLHPLAHLSANPGFVDTAWWRLSAVTPIEVIAVARASPPPGVVSVGTGGAGDTKTGTSSTGLTFFLKTVGRVLESRIVEVTATALAGGGTGVMVQSQSQWVVPRPAASVIRDGVDVIEVKETTATGRVLGPATVTAAARVRATVAYLNALESVQPGTIACGAITGGGDVVTVKFLSQTGRSPVATASFSDDVEQPGGGVSTECNSVELRVGTRSPVSLLGGNYISSLNRLLNAHIP
jgi:hypothetical protein